MKAILQILVLMLSLPPLAAREGDPPPPPPPPIDREIAVDEKPKYEQGEEEEANDPLAQGLGGANKHLVVAVPFMAVAIDLLTSETIDNFFASLATENTHASGPWGRKHKPVAGNPDDFGFLFAMLLAVFLLPVSPYGRFLFYLFQELVALPGEGLRARDDYLELLEIWGCEEKGYPQARYYAELGCASTILFLKVFVRALEKSVRAKEQISEEFSK